MPSLEILKELQDLNLADDVEIPPEAVHWTEEEANSYFESGGAEVPAPRAPAAASSATGAAPAAATSRTILRWVVDTSAWAPMAAEWAFLLTLVTDEEREKTMRFKFEADQKRALLSRLLQRAACHEAYGTPHAAAVIKRTKGGKPYLAERPAVLADAPNWNFNVSHEGDYVVLAAEPLLLCGIDVAAPSVARSKSGKPRDLEEHFDTLRNYFTALEWRTIRACGPSDDGLEACFRQHWSLKEAFTKARGDGIAFEFSRIEFTLAGADDGAAAGGAAGGGPRLYTRASVAVDGMPQPKWRFDIQPLKAGHWVSVARGPPLDAIDGWGGFAATFCAPQPAAALVAEHMQRSEPRLQPKVVAELVPQERREEHREAAAKR